jgi:hypothetical protein
MYRRRVEARFDPTACKPTINMNVDHLLETIRAEVKAQRAAQAPTAADDALGRDLRRAAEELEYTRVVSAHWPLEGRSLAERGWAFVNKVVRRYLRWYINPIVEQQNAYNDASARTMRLLIEANAELRAEVAALRAQLADAQQPPSADR